MQDEPWCLDAAREIKILSDEVLDFAVGRVAEPYGAPAGRVLVGA
jgi:hypothetical protein